MNNNTTVLATTLNVISSSTICSTSGAVSLALLAAQCLVSVGDKKDLFLNKIFGVWLLW